MEAVLNFVVQWLVSHYPVATQVLTVVGMLRLIFKPFCAFMAQVVDATPSQWDNDMWQKALASPIYKGITWFFDYFASVKLPQAPKAEAPKA